MRGRPHHSHTAGHTLSFRRPAARIAAGAAVLFILAILSARISIAAFICVLISAVTAYTITRTRDGTGKSDGNEGDAQEDEAHDGDVTPASTYADVRRELEEMLRFVAAQTGSRAAVLWRADTRRGSLSVVATHGRPAPATRGTQGDPLGWVASEGVPMRIEPAPSWTAAGAQVIAIRLLHAQGNAWVLTLEHDDTTLTPTRAATIASPLASLIELQQRRRGIDADRRRLQQLLTLLRRIPVASELEPAAVDLIGSGMQLTRATGGAVGTWDGAEGHIIAVHGGDGGPPNGAVFTSPSSEMALAVRAGQPLLREHGTWRPGPTQLATPRDAWIARPRTFVAIPLHTPAGITAVLALWSSGAEPLDDAGIDLITAVAPYAALHLEHAREFGRMKESAQTDGLTGLRNRRAFDLALLAETQRFERYGRPLALLMIDLDHFKSVNDTHGHQAGDAVLRTVAAVVRECVRDVDTAARYGGEEMAVLLPETSHHAAREVAERIRATIAARSLAWEGEPLRVTASIGVASTPETAATPAKLVAIADEAVYRAKAEGRNRVVG